MYSPKILIEKPVKNKIYSKKKFVIDRYVFLKHEKFLDKNIIKSGFIRGLDSIHFESSQKEIFTFINKCKQMKINLDIYHKVFWNGIEQKTRI